MFELPPTFNPARRHLLGAGSALALGGLLPAGAAAAGSRRIRRRSCRAAARCCGPTRAPAASATRTSPPSARSAVERSALGGAVAGVARRELQQRPQRLVARAQGAGMDAVPLRELALRRRETLRVVHRCTVARLLYVSANASISHALGSEREVGALSLSLSLSLSL